MIFTLSPWMTYFRSKWNSPLPVYKERTFYKVKQYHTVPKLNNA
jgi:hypothetical protein